MNYKKIHDSIIERARQRTLDGYGEWHHVIPRCMGGSDNRVNKVHLTAEEHFVVHQLLVKMYPDVNGLVYAVNRLTHGLKGKVYSNKMYGWLRKKFALAISLKHKGKQHRLGTIQSKITRKRISIGMKGNKHALGLKHSKFTRRILSEKLSGKKNPMYGKHHSKDTLDKLKNLHKGKTWKIDPTTNKRFWIERT